MCSGKPGHFFQSKKGRDLPLPVHELSQSIHIDRPIIKHQCNHDDHDAADH